MKTLAVSLIVSFVGAVQHTRRDLQDKPFVETGGFIGVIIAAVVLLLCFGWCTYETISSKKWVDNLRAELESKSKVADTPKGKIEYQLWGDAPYMLLMPGTPGFCHAEVGFFERVKPFGLITVSRPGYGRTPMTEELKKSSAQADLIMALMDHLNIEKLPILVASGAGVIGIRIAIQYPDRVQALCTWCATTGSYDHPLYEMFTNGDGRGMMESPTFCKYGSKNAASMFANIIAGDRMTANNQKPGTITQKEADEIAAIRVKDPYVMAMIPGLAVFPAFGALYPHYDIYKIDLDYYKDVLPLDQVKCPTHMVHGDCDDDIRYENAVRGHEGIKGSILITQKRGTHSCQFHEDYNAHIDQQMAFAKKHCGMTLTPEDQAALDKKFD